MATDVLSGIDRHTERQKSFIILTTDMHKEIEDRYR
jgi:hypothetical protein